MNGILLVNKPQGFSSHDVVNIVRRALGTKKVGHTGTLDPDATGLLVLGINDGTKIMKFLNNDEKEYIATACIGKSTDTVDKTGEVIDSKPVQDINNLEDVLSSFKGIYTQTPPMYSAIKYKGKRLYEYARKGIVIDDIPSRDIEVHNIELLGDIDYQDQCAYFTYKVHASKGLYVRTLSYDIGKQLGYPAHNYDLHRTKAGLFDINDSFTIDEIKEGHYKLLSLKDSLKGMQEIVLPERLRKHIKNGMAISLKEFKEPILTKIVDSKGNLLAIYDKHPTESKMRAVNIFYKE